MLNSEWLLRMLEKSSASPHGRLLAMFDIVSDWVDAPNMRHGFAIGQENGRLLDFLARQAKKSGAEQPEELARQLHFMLLGAVNDELRSPRTGALSAARQAAAVLLQAQLPARRTHLKSAALAASMAALLLSAGLLSMHDNTVEKSLAPPPASVQRVRFAAIAPPRGSTSPDQIASLYRSLAQIRKGECNYPHALMLPAELRGIYIDNVVKGEIPSENVDARQVSMLVKQVECYYPPVAMTAL